MKECLSPGGAAYVLYLLSGIHYNTAAVSIAYSNERGLTRNEQC